MVEVGRHDATYAVYAINEMLVEMLGVPKKYQGTTKFKGYFSTIYKWINKHKFGIQYIYFVVNRVYARWGRQKVKPQLSYAYFWACLRGMTHQYDADRDLLPSGGSREELLRVGVPPKLLPYHLQTNAERKEAAEAGIIMGGDIDNHEVDKFSEFMRRVMSG